MKPPRQALARARLNADGTSAGLEAARLAEALFDRLPDVVFFVKDEAGRYQAVNETLVERLGRRSKTEVLGHTPEELFPEPLGRRYAEQDRRVLGEGLEIRSQLELHLYRGGLRGWCLTDKLPLRDARGAIAGLAGLSRDLQPPEGGSADYRRVARAAELIRAGHAAPVRLEGVAREVGLGRRQLERLMRRVFGLSPGQLLVQARLESAARLLREGRLGISDVAQACGYADHSAFTRQFRATVGLTPTAFRRAFR